MPNITSKYRKQKNKINQPSQLELLNHTSLINRSCRPNINKNVNDATNKYPIDFTEFIQHLENSQFSSSTYGTLTQNIYQGAKAKNSKS